MFKEENNLITSVTIPCNGEACDPMTVRACVHAHVRAGSCGPQCGEGWGQLAGGCMHACMLHVHSASVLHSVACMSTMRLASFASQRCTSAGALLCCTQLCGVAFPWRAVLCAAGSYPNINWKDPAAAAFATSRKFYNFNSCADNCTTAGQRNDVRGMGVLWGDGFRGCHFLPCAGLRLQLDTPSLSGHLACMAPAVRALHSVYRTPPAWHPPTRWRVRSVAQHGKCSKKRNGGRRLCCM